MLIQYKNIDQIQNAAASISGDRISNRKTQFANFNINESIFFNTEITSQTTDSSIEIHVYSNDSWITGTHKVNIKNNIPVYRDSITNNIISFPTQPVAIDIYDELSKLNLTSGNFTIAVNFFKNLIGNYNRQHLRIDEISPDRTEIRLRAIDADDPEFLQQITAYINNVSSQTNPQTSRSTYKSYLLNFSRNQCALFVNSVVIGEYLYVKLYEPISTDIEIDFKCWVVEEQKPSYIDRISILPALIQQRFNKLANPNWYANASYNVSSETSFKNWTDLLGSSVQTSQQIVDAYFSGSLAGVKLNIDYSDFNNFIFYSSATERLENFKYKLQLLEYYSSQSLAISLISGSVATTNATDYLTQKNNLIGGFDTFEKFLYFESSSKLTTYDVPVENPTVADVTGSYISPVPKTTSSKPYALTSTTSSQFQTWYSAVYEKAVQYDSKNYNSLIQAVPEFIKFDSSNENLATFVNMLGHHYDILYTYINHMTRINKREENPKLGMPNELLYSVAKQFGWNLTDGNQGQELWQYVLGTNESGAPLTGSNSIGDPSVPGKNMTATIWRRIVNNLPLLLKSKGTKRSIQALLSCYGIPQSFISINEYGGPRLERAPVYEKLNFDYALDLIGSAAGNVVVNYNKPIQSVELRFRTADVIKNPTLPSTMNLYNIGSNSVTIDFSSGTLGVIQINGTGSAAFELFNGDWINTVLRVNGTNLDLIAKKSKYGKIVTTVSASATASFATTGSLTLGGTSTGASRLVGQIQELRLWTSSLQNSPYENHTKAPAAYDANIDAYNELVFRLPLTQKINHSTTSSIYGVQPASSSISASFTSWTNNTPYDSIEETYYYDAISLGAGTLDDNKIRLEENELVGTLDIATRAERSQFDKAPLDSKKLGVYFSPQTMINEDIIAQLGFTELDQYIGDPGQLDLKSYPDLIQTANSYWKKYESKNDINSYISMFTLYDLSFFRQLEQLLPARTDKLTGLLIQPNILERSKDTILPKIHRFDSMYTSSIDDTIISANGAYLIYAGAIADDILTIQGIDDDQWQMYLTASNADKYDSVPYSYDYLLRSGSTWITGSSPYWLSDALQPTYINAVSSEYRLTSQSVTYQTGSTGGGTTFGTGTYGTSVYYSDPMGSGFTGVLAQVQDYLPIGINRQRYDGTKMTSPAFNVNSTQTVDGGPVVEWRTANPNQLIYQTQNNNQGSFRLV